MPDQDSCQPDQPPVFTPASTPVQPTAWLTLALALPAPRDISASNIGDQVVNPAATQAATPAEGPSKDGNTLEAAPVPILAEAGLLASGKPVNTMDDARQAALTLRGDWQAIQDQAAKPKVQAGTLQKGQDPASLAFRGEVVNLAKAPQPNGHQAGQRQHHEAQGDKSKTGLPEAAVQPSVEDGKPGSESPKVAEAYASHSPSSGAVTAESAQPPAPPPAPGQPARAAASAPVANQPAVDKAGSDPIRSLEFKVTERNAPSVSLQVNDRGGRIEVAVRSADAALNQQLQSQLSSLTDRLQTRGLTMENIRTVEAPHSGDLSQQFSRDQRGQDSQGHSPWPRDHQPAQQGQPHSGRDRGLFRWADEVDEQPASSRKGR
ncbi:MAG: hypothetical protein IT161_12140 [Bryobacterales bacterium]|nr:hypothetical protein [Bryobacterales bacterium]